MSKTIVITGTTKGIGRAIAERFAKEKFNIAACARNENDLQQLKQEIEQQGVKVFIKPTDVSKKEEVKSFANVVLENFKTIDVLINNAGVFIPGQIQEEDEDVLEKMIETNLYSAYYLTRALLPKIKEQKKGHIFNICSTASIVPYINGGSYCISKFALLGFSKVLREEMKEHNIRVSSILPGATFTASWEGADIPEERFMKPEDIAEIIWSSYVLSERTNVEEILVRPVLGDV